MACAPDLISRNPTPTATTRGTVTGDAVNEAARGVPLGVGCGNARGAAASQEANQPIINDQLANPSKALRLTGQCKRPITLRRHGQHGVAYGVPLRRELRQHQRGYARAARRAVVRAGGKAAAGGQEQGWDQSILRSVNTVLSMCGARFVLAARPPHEDKNKVGILFSIRSVSWWR